MDSHRAVVMLLPLWQRMAVSKDDDDDKVDDDEDVQDPSVEKIVKIGNLVYDGTINQESSRLS